MTRTPKKLDGCPTVVNFQFEDRTYQIDPSSRKVYRRFIEIETSKAAEILTVWRASHAGI